MTARPAAPTAASVWYRTRVSESAPSAGRTAVTLGTATPGGGFPVYGQAVAETINGVDPSLQVQTRIAERLEVAEASVRAAHAAGVPIAAGVLYPVAGILLSPMIAAAAMSLSSVSVIVNATSASGG